ncbi:MAG TPA: hypothetical protein PKA76_15335 [Pirellulaceae bacterium]|nr:hypothetical protein [Pyrinomonadaceae bacterium]HMP65577.1 hypothetical protein [Pyrinomonadaceae bacterium]HMP70718.1 hypothetical protein [Pirellulaceae bacterium]
MPESARVDISAPKLGGGIADASFEDTYPCIPPEVLQFLSDFLLVLAPARGTRTGRLVKLHPMLRRAVCDSVNAWFENILSLRESAEVELAFYPRLAEILQKPEYEGFRKLLGRSSEDRVESFAP